MSIAPVKSFSALKPAFKGANHNMTAQSDSSQINFGESGTPKTRTSSFMWGLVLGLAAVGVTSAIFKKSILTHVHRQDVWNTAIKDLAAKAKKVGTYSLNDVKTYVNQNHRDVNNVQESFIYKLDKKAKRAYKISSEEALVIGYRTNSAGHKVTSVIKCDNFDKELLDSFGNSNAVHLTYKN